MSPVAELAKRLVDDPNGEHSAPAGDAFDLRNADHEFTVANIESVGPVC